MKPQVRHAKVSDALEIADLIRFTSISCCFSTDNPCPEWYLESIKLEEIATLLQDDYMDWAVVTQERALAGVLAIASKSHVKYFFVHPQFQRYGIGKLLWYFAEQSGLLGPSLTVRSSLFAVPVYERLGFVATNATEKFKGMEYQTMTAVRDLKSETV